MKSEKPNEKKEEFDVLPIGSAIARLLKLLELGKCTFEDVFFPGGRFHCFTGKPKKRRTAIDKINMAISDYTEQETLTKDHHLKELQEMYCIHVIPDGFLKGDIRSRSNRHLLFATNQQLQQLVLAKNWYVDSTFKLCPQPFTQLFSINAFVRSGEQAKQVPLLFVLMSGKRKRDYRAVLKEVLRILPSPPAVRSITLDFERAVWTVFRELLPNVSLQGCLFHWTQALWRKVGIINLDVYVQKVL